AVAKVVDRGVSGAHVAVGLGLMGCLLVIARAQGLAATELGAARARRAGRPAGGSGRSDPGWGGLCPGLPDRADPGGAPRWWRRPRTGGAVEGPGRDPAWDRPSRGTGLPGPAADAAGPPLWRGCRDPVVLGAVRPVACCAVAGRRDDHRHDRCRGGR